MTQDSTQTATHGMRDLFLLTVLISLFFGFMLGNRPLSVPDEGRYVEIPREMVVTGDYLTPRLNGVKYFEKPVLFYWLEGFSIKHFGLKGFALRLWPALFALMGCLVVYGSGVRLFGRRSGLISAMVLATSLLYYALSRAIILDMPVSALLSVALLCFLLGTHEPHGLRRRLLMWGFYLFAALAVMTKGLIGILIPGMVIGIWIVLLGEWRVLKTMYLPSGLLLFLLIAAPWHILVNRANPEFFNFYFIHEHFLRYLTKIHSRYKPAWFFIPVVLLGLFPWSAFLIQAVKHNLPPSWRERHEHRDTLFLLLWAGFVFLFFSASSSKLIPYILPVFPPLSLLIGRYLAEAWDCRDFPGIRTGYAVLLIVTLGLTIALIVLPHYRISPDVQRLGKYPYVFAAILIIGTAVTWFMSKRKNFRWAFLSLTATTMLFFIVVNAAASVADERSSINLASVLKQRLKPGDEVASYDTYYQDLPVYLERRITVVNWKGELEFGTTVEDTSQWMVDDATFWKRWDGPSTVYMLTKRGTYDALQATGHKNVYLIASTDDNILAVNKEMTP
ncbi:MAG TPA: phospholipid carrier-dependent glycosyltransferase [Nitrospirota bacterium]|nr:phospholipid carrier-dependent glycosyltransferase [Nitrospirota bacterium]